MSNSGDVSIEMSEKQQLESSHPETVAALNSALNNIDPEVKQLAMEHSSDFSLKAAPSVDLYLNTQKQKKYGKPQRPQMDSLFERGASYSADGLRDIIPAAEGRDISDDEEEASPSVDATKGSNSSNEENDEAGGKKSKTMTTNNGNAGTKFSAAIEDEKVKFGMFEGVFARCLLNIWGVIMFLRMGWMVGHAGAGLATSIILVAMVITLITTLSLSAICTNGQVSSGGAYFLISRSLGPEFGGAIGILFSLANATAVALHLIGFAETLFGIYNGTARGIPYPPPPEYYGGITCPCINVNGIESCPSAIGAFHSERYGLLANTTALYSASFLTHCGLWDERLIAILSLTLLICIALVGVEWVVKFQLFLLFLLVASLLSYFFGTFLQPIRPEYAFVGYNYTNLLTNIQPNFQGTETWITLFAVFFPASTGIMAGANISGDLKDAQTAIPTGTLAAVIVSGVTYIAMVWTLASICERNGGRGGLFKDFAIMMPASADWIEESAVAPLIVAGIVASSLSSALAALVGAPRVFQAVCKDPLFPILKPFAKGRGANEEPVNAYCLTFAIAVGFMMIGSLNAIAPFITNFFMISYALINFAAFAADMSGSPGWRPTWTFYNPYVSLLGAGLCLGSMFMISWYVALITLLVCFGLHSYVGHLKPDVDWGSVGSALTYRRTVEQLMALGRSKQSHVKNYRISCCVMAGVPGRRSDLVFFFDQLRGGGGLMVAGNVIKGDLENSDFISPLLTAHLNNNYYSENKFKAVQEVVVAPTLVQGARILLLTCGVGKLRPNLLGFGFREAYIDGLESKLTFDYVQALRDALRLNFSVSVLRNYVHERVGKREKAVDVDAIDINSLSSSDGQEGVKKVDDNTFDNLPLESSDVLPGSITNRNILSLPRKPSNEIKISQHGSFHEREAGHRRTASESESQRSTVSNSNLISSKGRKGKIDVWWLDDTGGLTILLPNILLKKWHWSGCSIRVFVFSNGKDIEEQTSDMKELLHKVRINIESIKVLPKPRPDEVLHTENAKLAVERMKNEISNEEAIELIKLYEQQQEVEEETTLLETDDSSNNLQKLIDLGIYKDSSERIARKAAIGKLIKENSLDDTLLVVCTMPFPHTKVPALVHMSCMDVMSKPCGKPFLFVRGTQKRILTVDS